MNIIVVATVIIDRPITTSTIIMQIILSCFVLKVILLKYDSERQQRFKFWLAE
jgi:hypothetical protein